MTVCEMQTDPSVFHLKCLLEGTLYKELGDEDMAIQVTVLIYVSPYLYSAAKLYFLHLLQTVPK